MLLVLGDPADERRWLDFRRSSPGREGDGHGGVLMYYSRYNMCDFSAPDQANWDVFHYGPVIPAFVVSGHARTEANGECVEKYAHTLCIKGPVLCGAGHTGCQTAEKCCVVNKGIINTTI